MKIPKFFSLLFLFITCLNINAHKYTSGTNLPYINPTPGEITIMACSPISDGMEPSRQAYQNVVDCGFNLVTNRGSIDYFKNVFSLLGDLNLRYLISNPSFNQNSVRQSYISAFANDPHLGGWLLRDEPFYDTWGELSNLYKTFSQEDPKHSVYVNLVGMIYTKFTGPNKTIAEYLENYQKLFTPSFFSYDFYPILIKNGKMLIEYDQFYTDLEEFSYISRKYERPFWAFCESIAYYTTSYSRPVPTEAYFRFEAYNALAYGAQAIVYWAYGMRNSSNGENFTSALVDFKGNKTKAWYAAQKVNSQIKKFMPVFYECEVKDVKHTGDRIYKGTSKLSGAFGPFSMIRSKAAGLVVSRIENNGKKYIVIVNRDIFNKQKIALELAANKTVVNLTSSKQTRYSGIQDIAISLDKADWAIFEEL